MSNGISVGNQLAGLVQDSGVHSFRNLSSTCIGRRYSSKKHDCEAVERCMTGSEGTADDKTLYMECVATPSPLVIYAIDSDVILIKLRYEACTKKYTTNYKSCQELC